MTDKHISDFPTANPPDGTELLAVWQASTMKSATSAILGNFTGVNVKSYGAAGDGVTDDTTACQNAANAISSTGGVLFFPAGKYLLTASIKLKSNTIVWGYGATLVASGSWTTPSSGDPAVAPGYAIIANATFGATSITDSNITVLGLGFDYQPLYTANGGTEVGGSHAIRFRKARNTTVRDCYFNKGNDAVAAIGCDSTLVESCYANLCDNAAFDHWEGTTDSRVINNIIIMSPLTVPQASDGILWSATNTAQNANMTIDGFLAQGNYIYNAAGVGIFCNILYTSGSCYRGQIIGNRIYGNNTTTAGIALTGAGGHHIIHGNIVYQTNGNTAIGCGPDPVSGQSPSNCVVSGNIIDGVTAPQSANGAISLQGTASSVFGNVLIGGTRYYDIGLVGNNNTAFGNIADNAQAVVTVGGTGCSVITAQVYPTLYRGAGTSVATGTALKFKVTAAGIITGIETELASSSSSVTVQVQKNGTSITGLNAVALTGPAAVATTAASALNTIVPGDYITVNITAITGTPSGLRVQLLGA